MEKFFRREMAITHQEFFRLLPAAVKLLSYKITGNVIDIGEGARTVSIELENETVRKVSSLSLPVTRLSITFNGYNEQDIEAFMKQFERAYQKGGG